MVNPISKAGAWVLAKAADSRPYKALENKVDRTTADNIIAYTTIGSVAAKDIVGCAMYVYQSLNNDKIPEKRRRFVAALDLTNGVLMVASQVAMFFAMRRINEKLFHGLLKSFDKEGVHFGKYSRQIRANERRLTQDPSKVTDKSELRTEYASMKDMAFSLFKSVTELAAATIVAKRIIVPFIATPLASKVEKMMNKKDYEQPEADANNQNPAMKGNADELKQIPEQTEAADGNTNLLDKYRKQSYIA